ncbi:MAG: thiol:disulfide interchange protein DsbA/DsbL [Chromatiales bacterium]|nr:MAG: thiol:disulfide interchange protein DsbA/DsbL [Chromatiales bacterium]
MKNHRLFVCLLLAFVVSACGTEDNATGTPPAAAEAERAAPPPPAPAPVPATAPVEDDEPPASDEDTPDVVAETTQEKPQEPAAPVNTNWQYETGKHYSQLTSAQGTTGGPGGVEVTEVFWYGCPHCFSFDPIITRWEDEQPADVRFVRLPVMWNPTNEIHARMYYTAEALGKLDEMHQAFFTALHRDGKTLTREDDIRKIFADFGVSKDEFDNTFRSFAVESKLNRAKSLTQRYRIRSVPVIVVDGKYVVDGPEVKSYSDMLAVTDELVAKERIER